MLPRGGPLQDLIVDTIAGIAAASALIHAGSFLMVLASTRRHGAGTRIGLLSGSLIPFLGPVLAIFTAWNSRGSRGEPKIPTPAGRKTGLAYPPPQGTSLQTREPHSQNRDVDR